MSTWRRRLRGDRGASAVEYGLIAVAIAAVIVTVVFVLGGRVRAAFTSGCTAWNSAITATDSCG